MGKSRAEFFAENRYGWPIVCNDGKWTLRRWEGLGNRGNRFDSARSRDTGKQIFHSRDARPFADR